MPRCGRYRVTESIRIMLGYTLYIITLVGGYRFTFSGSAPVMSEGMQRVPSTTRGAIVLLVIAFAPMASEGNSRP